jgi:hypothetical protein
MEPKCVCEQGAVVELEKLPEFHLELIHRHYSSALGLILEVVER